MSIGSHLRIISAAGRISAPARRRRDRHDTYTQWSYVTFADRTYSPAAGQVTLDLVNLNNVWSLHAITGDHVVPDCQSST